MNPFRPYKTKHDSVREDTTRVSLNITLNLFDVITWMECDNNDRHFHDEIMRTEVIMSPNNSFYIQKSYKEFDAVMTQFYEQYKCIDKRSVQPPPIPDKEKYSGLMQAAIVCNDNEVYTVFHRKGYEAKDYNDAVFNCLFSNITPMN